MANLRQNSNLLLPREKLLKFGLENLKDYELLAILLGTGSSKKNVLELSKEILQKYDLERFQSITLEELKKIHGISLAKASKILASIEFARKVLKKPKKELLQITDSKTAAQYLNKISNYKKEVLAVLYLNANSQIIHEEIVSIGSLNSVLIHPREVFEIALRKLSAYIIIAHNHPSGNLQASEYDIEMTQKIKKAGEILGIEVIDSLIITSCGYTSIL
jgi:DNA repair protein RadC